MSKYSTLSIDLNNEVTPSQRDAFYKELEARKWNKITTLTTLWQASWKDEIRDDDIISGTKTDVEEAAKKNKIPHYDAAVSLGKPTIWKK